ncbi:MAG: GIY-YIG nuclease family protein [Gammaproteobacteria bacterium]
MPYYTYILHSTSIQRYYCGFSQDPHRRLREHNDPNYTLSKTTKRFPGPWKLVWTEKHLTASEAMKQEKQIKKRGIGRFLQDSNKMPQR